MKKSWLLLLVPLSLLVAFYSALGRVGWNLPIPAIAAKHGFLMVSGLFGTLISLERSLIMRKIWWLGIPVASAVSVVLVLMQLELQGFWVQLAAAAGLSFLYLKQALRYREIYFAGLLLSGLAWCMSAAVLIAGRGFVAASIWYILFLLFTIVSERMELSKFVAKPGWAQPLLLTLLVLLVLSQALPFHLGANQLTGLLMAAVAYWLLSFDMVNINLRKKGFFYFSGSTLFGGYLWLMLSGVLMALPLAAPYHYDAVLHSFFIGFAFSMLFAHAPIIFPALIKMPVKVFHPFFYFPVFATHALLLLRLYADYSANWQLRKWAGMLQVLVIILFFLSFGMLLNRERNNWKTGK